MIDKSQKELPLLTFNSLYNLLREEKRSKLLQQLPEEFYLAVDKFFSDKKNEIKKLKEENNVDNLKKAKKIILNSEQIINELLVFRCNKIAKISITNTIYKENIFEDTGILKVEKEYFENISKLTKKIVRQSGK